MTRLLSVTLLALGALVLAPAAAGDRRRRHSLPSGMRRSLTTAYVYFDARARGELEADGGLAELPAEFELSAPAR